MFKFPVRAGLLGLPICLLVTLIAFGESAPRIQRQLEATAQSLMEPFPGVEISVDGRDITLAGEPQRAAGDGLDVAVAQLRATEGVRRVEVGFDTAPIVAEPPAPPKPEELAGLATIDPTKPLTIDLNSASRVDFAAVIQASVLPEWEANEDDDPCFIAFGDDINTEFAACISADRKNLTLKNDDKFEYLAYDFSAPRPYRIEIEINDAESVVRIDGVIAGTLPVGLIAPSTRTLNIGSLDGMASQFTGKVGRVRVWNRGSLDLLTGIADTDAAPGWQARAPGFTPHYDNLVLYSRIGAEGSLEIVMPAAKTDPVGMWYAKDESPVDHIAPPPPPPGRDGKTPPFNEAPYGNYSSYKILKVERSLPDGGLIATSDSGGAPPFWVKPGAALSGRFTRESDGVYRAGGRATGEKGGAATSTSLYLFTPDLLNLDGGVSLARFELDPDGAADDAKKDPWDSTFVNPEQIKNSFYSFAGFDITRMNPVNLGDLEGVRAPVFAKPLPGSTNYKATGEGRYAPASHFFRPIFSAEEVNSVETTKSELELRDNLARSLGFNIGLEKVGSFGASKSFARKKTALTASEFQHGYGESRVLHYSLILDKSKAELAPGFRDAVLELAQKSDDAALDAFVQRFGTHYPYAVTYGGKVHMEFRKTYSVNKSGVDRDDQFKAEANAELEGAKAGGNVSKDTGTGNTASAESGIEVTNIFVSGGRGTASHDHLEIQDTVVPVYMDLRPITELLSPVYFDDQAITWTLRNALETRIAAYRRKYENNSSSLAFAHYSVRVARVICVDDGDQTLAVSNGPGSQIMLDPIAQFFKPIVEAVAGAAGAAMPVINDQPNVCELNGIASATLAEGTKLLDPQTRRAFADTNDSVTLTFFGMNISVSFYGAAGFGDRDARTKLETNSAFWIAPVPPEKTPLSVTEGWQFAAQPSTKGSELLLTIPRDQVSRYSLSLWASMSEVDTVDMVSGTTTKSSTPYSLWMFGSGKADLNNIGSEPFAITLKATGECKPNAMWACPEAPFASAIAGEVRVEFEIQKLD